MVTYGTGNLLAANNEALVNSVNCVGVMGRGIALEFKRKFPDNFNVYKAACDLGEVRPGRMFVFGTSELIPRYIINFPTKRHWRGKSRLDDIEAGLSCSSHGGPTAQNPLHRAATARLRARGP